MKKLLCSLSCLLVFVGVFFASCGPTSAEKEKARVERKQIPNPVVWDTLSVVKTKRIGLDSVEVSCTFSIDFIIPKEYQKAEIIQTIQKGLNYSIVGDDETYVDMLPSESLDKYMNVFLGGYEQETKEKYLKWKEANDAREVYSYTKKIETEVMYNEANLISYQIRIVDQRGDALPMLYCKNLLFDLTDGRKLGEEDIFAEDYSEELNKIIIEQLLRDNGVQTVEELQALGYWGARDIAANDNFYIDQNGITYTFNPGEYSDAGLGLLDVFINYDDLYKSIILKKNSPIVVLVTDPSDNNMNE